SRPGRALHPDALARPRAAMLPIDDVTVRRQGRVGGTADPREIDGRRVVDAGADDRTMQGVLGGAEAERSHDVEGGNRPGPGVHRAVLTHFALAGGTTGWRRVTEESPGVKEIDRLGVRPTRRESVPGLGGVGRGRVGVTASQTVSAPDDPRWPFERREHHHTGDEGSQQNGSYAARGDLDR